LTKRLFTLLAIFSLVATLFSFNSGTANAGDGDRSKIDKEGRELLATAAANGNASVTLLIATADGAVPSVANALQALGGNVRKRDLDVGYIRVDIAADKADQASKLSGVLAAMVDDVIPLVPPAPEADDAAPDVAPPGPTTSKQNPYMPTQDIGAPQFVAANPTFDGRGVTIGILDTGVDLGHPTLQTTTTGERKIVDWVTMTDPLTDGDPTWIVMGTTVTVTDGTFTVSGKTYTGAPDGTWKFGVLKENSLGTASEYGGACAVGADLNRNGICGESFAILWDGVEDGTVIVDSDADGSFAGEKAMLPYRINFDVGEFGHDNASTAIRESVPFVVQTNAATNTVNIGIPSGAHATHVAGIAAGHGFFDGAYDGAAPGAKIVSIRVCLFVAGCTFHGLTEGMIFAVKNEKVDTVNMSIGGLPALNDGNDVISLLYNRLIDRYHAQMFISAGNSGPGVNTVGFPSVATKVMSIGAYWSRDTVLANYGATVSTAEALHDFSSRGPREDGGLKPSVVAPGSAVSGVPTWQPGNCVAYACPPGYGMFNGTSMAAPEATGASALLLSAAFQTDHGHKPAQLRQAMTSSARFIGGYAAHEQGFGLLNVGAAWNLLSQDVKTADITSAVPTSTLLSGFLTPPGIGTGIYDRENAPLGTAPYTRTYTFTKRDGGGGTYNISWIGNDGTFSTSGVTSLTLSKQKQATLVVTITPTTVGTHSALLVLDDPNTVGIDYTTMNTVMVSQPLNAANGYIATMTGLANRFEDSRPNFLFKVPAGTTAVKFTIMRTNGGRIAFNCVHPYGLPSSSTTNGCNQGFVSSGANPRTAVIANPTPGVWEVGLRASRTSVANPATFTVKAEAFRVTFDPTSWTQSPAAVGTTYSTTFTGTNAYAAGTIANTGSDFASVFTANKTIAAAGPRQTVDINVPPGSTNLTVTIGNASDPGADLDLFVFDCTAGPNSCVLKGSGTGSTANETVSINNPAAGAWRAMIDPFAVPAGSTTYTYTDAITNGALYGKVTATVAASPRGSGATWPVPASGKATASAGSGRFLRGSVNARLDSDTGAVLGSATVTFNTP
jgi:subtilisin family serine protease